MRRHSRHGASDEIAGVWIAAGLSAAAASAYAADKVRFGTNWLAEAEHGGYYQAVADGTYAKYGLDVDDRAGRPAGGQRHPARLRQARLLHGLEPASRRSTRSKQNVPIVVVAAHFQKDPQMVMSHPGVGLDKFTDLVNSPAYIGKGAPFYEWMVSAYGFKEENVKPYTFNPQPFIADKHSIQQGYITSEPYAVEKMGKFKPNIFLFADLGFSTYATTVETRRRDRRQEARPRAALRRRLDDRLVPLSLRRQQTANELIKKDNPEMTDDQIAFSIGKMKEYGLVDSGDTLTQGHRRHDRRARQGLLRQDGEGGRRAGRSRLQEGLHAAIRQQGRGLDQRAEE